MSRRKVCVVTGTRADYGLLYFVMKEIEREAGLELQLVVTGMHLSPEFGLTYRVIEEDGFRIDARVEMLLSSDTPVGVAKSLGLGVIGFAEVLERLRPDLLLILGDRFEMLAAAQAALVAGLPIAHVAGGDTTEGAFDEAIRHSITKMSHLHLVTNEVAAGRVRQLGENPACIFQVGSPGLDQIANLKLLERGELEDELQFQLREKNLLITFHPATLELQSATEQFQALLDGLDLLGPEVGLIFTLPNADPQGRGLIEMTGRYLESRPHARAYTSLGQLRYLSAMARVDAVVGNSSSGLYEAPYLKKPTVNIGDRQKGRVQASSVINVPPQAGAIAAAVREAFARDCSAVESPYGEAGGAKRIVSVLQGVADYRALLKKEFFQVERADG